MNLTPRMAAQLDQLGIPGVDTLTSQEILEQLLNLLIDESGTMQVRAIIEGGHWTGADVRALILGPQSLAEAVSSLYPNAALHRPPTITQLSDIQHIQQWVCCVDLSGQVLTEQQREIVQVISQGRDYATFTDSPRGPLAFGYSRINAEQARALAKAEIKRALLDRFPFLLD